jgi:hypothetical protein
LVRTQQNSFPDQMFDMQKIVLELEESDANPYCVRYTPIETVRYLLSVSITMRIDTLNVERWRVELENGISAFPVKMSLRKHNATILYTRLAEYELVKEAASVLELALWRKKIDEVDSATKRAKVDNEMNQRDKCRINCGGDIIIPVVLCYLMPLSATTSVGAS